MIESVLKKENTSKKNNNTHRNKNKSLNNTNIFFSQKNKNA